MIVGLSYFTTAKSQVTASVFKSSVMSEEAFIKKRKKLVASGLLYAPRVAKKNVIKDAATYEPPTLETSQELLEQLANKERKKRPTRSGGPASTLEVNLRGDRQQRSKKARDDLDDSDDDEDYGASDEGEGYTV